MTLEPFGPDLSSLDVPANQCATWTSVNLSDTTDTSGNACGTGGLDPNVELAAPTGAWGY